MYRALSADHDDHFAALMGAIPIAIGFGAGAASRRPLGLAVVGGLLFFAAHHALYHAGNLHLS